MRGFLSDRPKAQAESPIESVPPYELADVAQNRSQACRVNSVHTGSAIEKAQIAPKETHPPLGPITLMLFAGSIEAINWLMARR